MNTYSKFLQQAKQGKNTFGRYLLVFLIAWAVPTLLQYLVREFVLGYTFFDDLMGKFFESNFFRNILAVVLLFFLVERLHKRPGLSLINTEKHIRWDRLGFSFLVSAVLVFVLSVTTIYLLYGKLPIWEWQSDYEYSQGLVQKLLYFPSALIMATLLFNAYLLQGLSVRPRTAMRAILIVWLISYIFSHWSLIWYTLKGTMVGDLSWTWFINGSVILELLLLVLIILDEGVEAVLGFFIGKSVYSILVDEGALQKMIFPDSSSFNEGFIYFFSFDWGILICFGIFFFLYSRRFKLRDREVLFNIPPSPTEESYDLIDQIKPEEDF
jgi:hypothetical protein